MSIQFPIIWFITIFFWLAFITKKQNNSYVWGQIIISLIAQFLAFIFINKAIDIVDFGNNRSDANIWIISSLISFLIGLTILMRLQFTKK